ncbi:MAG: DNA polymerase III subunit alpha [Bacteroides sp.]|nr:MAG: DNA polymerase III subunit alpha [Bacteroides sp.]
MIQFTHLHLHTQYSLLDGAANISELAIKAKKDNMNAIAITDHGNMFGSFQFVNELNKYNIKPIVGCEFYLVKDRMIKNFDKFNPDKRFHQLLLAKNITGYNNLVKLCSLGYIDGLYNKWPRIDKYLVQQYHKGLIATTCCMNSEISRNILDDNLLEAEEIFKWWLNIFEKDYYIELQRHNIKGQDKINNVLLIWAKKYKVKIIASNDVHYVDKSDHDAHDSLLCINTGSLKKTPIGRGKHYRFGFPNNEFYFKTLKEMSLLFSDIPEALDNTQEIVDKVDKYNLKRNITLPDFSYPKKFKNVDDYLRHITYLGAKNRYSFISNEIIDKINFELTTIKQMGFSSYFLIVYDCINASKKMGVMVGPGRGSAAGSIVSYCIGITNIDPIKYNLLFERFLNPNRTSMPDIDIDFDNEGRQKVIDYVVNKYGYYQVAHIITYGSMAAKMSIKDVARVLELPIDISNRLSKLIPDKSITLKNILKSNETEFKKIGYSYEEINNLNNIKKIYNSNTLSASVIKHASLLEGSVRNTGIHAAGIIIAPKNITEYIPVCKSKESKYLITQYDGKVIEEAGLLKMDFLGLKTLSIIRETIKMIKEDHQYKDFDIYNIPLNDYKTFLLFQNGKTNGIFQFESLGMQKYLKQLKPDKIDDLIAMNALYRPGPMEYIPNFIRRKHGKEKIQYYFPEMKNYLSDTYGIIIYQEQVMKISQDIAGFTKYEADHLRKVMGKKLKKDLSNIYDKYIKGCKQYNRDIKICKKIWNDLESFASYAFNKSHSTCYAILAYQTAYLKSHFGPYFMASVLNVQINIDKISFIIKECISNNIHVLGPDINDSQYKFSVNKDKKIRFGLIAIKGLGIKAVENILEERKQNGAYKSIFDFAKRTQNRIVNKTSYESLVYSGAFDCFGNLSREVFFTKKNDNSFIELLIKLSSYYQSIKQNKQKLLFDNNADNNDVQYFKIPKFIPWALSTKLKYEKDTIGVYISENPLNKYKAVMDYICNTSIENSNLFQANTKITCYGIVNNIIFSNNKYKYCKFNLEYYYSNIILILYGDKINKYKNLIKENNIIYIELYIKTNNNGNKFYNIVNIYSITYILRDFIKSIIIKNNNAIIQTYISNDKKDIPLYIKNDLKFVKKSISFNNLLLLLYSSKIQYCIELNSKVLLNFYKKK